MISGGTARASGSHMSCVSNSSSRGHVLVSGVAKALSFAIDTPSVRPPSGCGHASTDGFPGAKLRKRPVLLRVAEVFNSSVIPPIAIDKYLARLTSTFQCSDATFVAALIIVERLLANEGCNLSLTTRNVHRVFLASLVVAVKYHEDVVFPNSHYARAGGVHLREVNRLERVLLVALDFDLGIHPEQYRLYEVMLLNLDAASLPLPNGGYPGPATYPNAAPAVALEASRPRAPGAGVPSSTLSCEEVEIPGEEAEDVVAALVAEDPVAASERAEAGGDAHGCRGGGSHPGGRADVHKSAEAPPQLD